MRLIMKKQWLCVFIFVLSVFVYFPGYAGNYNLVSNVDGKIHAIILHYGDGGFGGFWYDQTVLYRELLEKMDKDVGFVILLGKDSKTDDVKEVLKAYEKEKLPDGTPRVKYLNVDVKTGAFYPWARDPYMIQTDKDNNMIFLDAGYGINPFPVTNFNRVFDNVKVRAGVVHRGGGNIRTTDEEIFLGMDTILGIKIFPRAGHSDSQEETVYSKAKEVKKENLPAFKERFEAYVDLIHYILAPEKKLVIPGKSMFFSKMEKGEFVFNKKSVRDTGAQAAYHTDVYLTLGHKNKDGKRILFIADSGAAAKIVEQMSPEERRKVEQKLPEVLVQEGFTAYGVPLTKEQIARRCEWEKYKLLDLGIKKAKEIAGILDEAAKEMEGLGYIVYRAPYLPNGLNNEDDRNDDAGGIGFNYSNVLVEVYDDVKKIYMPECGFKQLDEAAAKAYEAAGFKVILLKGLLTNSVTQEKANAGLDCLTSEIRFPVKWEKSYYVKK